MAWAPLVRFRRWVRPHPTVGWVFLADRAYQRTYDLRFFGRRFGRRITGVQQDIFVPGDDPEVALLQAMEIAETSLGPTTTIIAMRTADRRDIPEDWDGPRVGPRDGYGYSIR